jgi:UDP-N-acetylglucosamine 2-epimerase
MVTEPWDVGVAGHYYRQRSHQLASLIFTQDRNTKRAFGLTERGKKYVKFTGSPKIDSMMKRARKAKRVMRSRYRIVWAPHHSYGPLWLNFGTFAQMHNQMLDFAAKHKDVDIVFKPHPFLLGTMTGRELMSQQELDDWVKAWDALPNTSTNTDSDYVNIFVNSDMLICDGISFLGEYPLITGRPAVFIENKDHWAFSPLGETIAKTTVGFKDFEDFANSFEKLKTEGLPDRSQEIENFMDEAIPFPRKAARKIIKAVVKDFAKKKPLVDASKVTATTWEQEAEARKAANVKP